MSSFANDELQQAVRLLEQGQVIGLPTETVYGLAADALNPTALALIFSIKGRPSHHPLILHLADASWLPHYTHSLPPSALLLANAFWPGPLTLLVPKSDQVPDAVTGGRPTVAVRVPAHPLARQVIQNLGRPVAAPSANRFGSVSPTSKQHVLDDLGNDVPLVLDGGPCSIGVESTIVDCTSDSPRLVRPGSVSRADLERVLGVAVPDQDGSVQAPGTLASHYAPRAPVLLVSQEELTKQLGSEAQNLGLLLGVITQAPFDQTVPAHVRLIVLPEDLPAAAQRLYASLRQLDEQGCTRILSTLPPEEGVGLAMADRLRRAAAPRH